MLVGHTLGRQRMKSFNQQLLVLHLLKPNFSMVLFRSLRDYQTV